jgi:DNA-binding CsgD family transcriptional regulator/PAS domain-containing protein
MPGLDETAELIDLIYDAAVDASVWPRVIDRLADLCGASSAQVLCQDFKTLEVTNIAPRFDPEIVRSYAERWVHGNPLSDAWNRTQVGAVTTFDAVMPRRELARTAIYNEFFLPGGMAEVLGSRLLAEGSFAAVVSLFRPAHKGAFGRQQERLLGGLIHHLQRALRLHLRLAEVDMRRAASAELLDRLSQAALLVDAAARVLFANRAAEDILADCSGLHRGADGTLYNGRQGETSRLHKLVAHAAARDAPGLDPAGDRVRLSRGEARTPLTVLVIPLRAATDWLAPRCPVAMLFINDPERPNNPTAERLQKVFGLTRTEAAVAMEVLNGHGLQAAATALGVAPVTVRTHLTAVFGKTGTHRQAELVRVLLQHASVLRDT